MPEVDSVKCKVHVVYLTLQFNSSARSGENECGYAKYIDY